MCSNKITLTFSFVSIYCFTQNISSEWVCGKVEIQGTTIWDVVKDWETFLTWKENNMTVYTIGSILMKVQSIICCYNSSRFCTRSHLVAIFRVRNEHLCADTGRAVQQKVWHFKSVPWDFLTQFDLKISFKLPPAKTPILKQMNGTMVLTWPALKVLPHFFQPGFVDVDFFMSNMPLLIESYCHIIAK